MTIHFDSSITKVDKSGNVILSNTLSKGEKLISGETYKQVQARMNKDASSAGIPATTETTTVEVQALTADPTLTSTVSSEETKTVEITGNVVPQNIETAAKDAPVLGDGGEKTSGELKGTENETGDSTAIVPVEEDDKKDEEVERPKDDAPKPEWFDYAKSKGFDGEYDDITKNQLIEQYGG